MKKTLFFVVALSVLVACGGNPGNKRQTASAAAENAQQQLPSYTLDELLSSADKLVDQTVRVRGYVTHTCKHAGKRCFIMGDDQKTSFRVEAKGNIGGFNRELVGSQIEISGILRERRLSREYLDQTEKDLTEKKVVEDGSADSCTAELDNIAEMKAWMQEHGKDYYAVYYMDGEDYEVVEE